MIRRLPIWSRSSLGGVVPAWFLAPVVAIFLSIDTAGREPAAKAADEKTELAELLDDAKNYAIRATKPEVELKLRETPVLNFTNPERNQERGSIFVWLHDGRPVAIGQFFRFNVRGGRVKKHALHSLSAWPLEAKFHDRLAWAPEQPGIAWQPFPDAPAVAARRPERLLQMRQLARPFEVKLTDPKDQATKLRLAPRPLFEYSAPGAGVTDGLIFSYLIATDPEAILLIEAFDENGKTGYRYAFARFHFQRLTATLGKDTVWDVAYDPSMMRNSLGNPEAMKKVYNSFHP